MGKVWDSLVAALFPNFSKFSAKTVEPESREGHPPNMKSKGYSNQREVANLESSYCITRIAIKKGRNYL
jgi:putative hemolysin